MNKHKAMRDLKFRVWDNNVRYMSSGFTLREINTGKLQFSGRRVVLQFTGLFDKRKKEIYEGDIILDTLTNVFYEVKFGFCKKEGFNGWYGMSLNIDNRIVAINGDYDTNTNSQIELVGNIYENPAMLNKEQKVQECGASKDDSRNTVGSIKNKQDRGNN